MTEPLLHNGAEDIM